MSDVSAKLRWVGTGLSLNAESSRGQSVRVDSGGASGPSPMELLLFALAGCTAIDIIDIAQKMRVEMQDLQVEIEGDRALEPPRRYTSIRTIYRVRGVGAADHDKIRRAVALSEEKYCSVRHSLAADIELSSTLDLA